MKKITLLGSGKILLNIIKFIAEDTKFEKILVGYAPRHGKGFIDLGITFEQKLKELCKNYSKLSIYCIESLEDKNYDILCNSDIQISLGSAWIFKKKHIDKAPYLIHAHCTDLPKYRGGASASWMLMSRYRNSAISIFRMNEGIDAGNLIFKKDFSYPAFFTKPKEYDDFTEKELFSALKEFINNFQENKTLKEGSPQDESISTYFPRLSSDIHSWINWDWKCEDVISFINAFGNPYQGAKTRLTSSKDSLVRIKDAKLFVKDGSFHPFKNGLIYRIFEGNIYVACHPHSLRITDISFEDEPINLKVGDRFYCLSSDLDEAKSKRIYYFPK
tara:strand:- start:9436 stop:10428 length:993 start_codon:yes stop_codon:yes gene_type:complete